MGGLSIKGPIFLCHLRYARLVEMAVDAQFFVFRANGDEAVVVRALYDFSAERSNELSFSAGDEMASSQQVNIYVNSSCAVECLRGAPLASSPGFPACSAAP